MTPRQERFVAEYLVDLNATQAAIRAGYSARTAQEQSSRLLSNVMVRQAIAQARAEHSRRTAISADMVVAELAKLGFANMADFVSIGPDGTPHPDLSQVTRDQMAAVAEITVEEFMDGPADAAREVRRVKLKLAGKHGPLVDLGKHFGLFQQRNPAIEDATDEQLAAVLAAVGAARRDRGEGQG